MKIHDLHSHTYYSNCGRDEPEKVAETYIKGGIELMGITDHNYGIGNRKPQYFEEMRALREKYKEKIEILCGIEIATIENKCILPEEDISYFDYCLIEHIDREGTCVGTGIVDFSKRCGTLTGIAHTDIFTMMENLGIAPEKFLKELADNNIFWEMNVNYDSIHGYREHEYVKRFCNDKNQQKLIRDSGLKISVGFDGHRVEDYRPERVIEMCRFLEENNLQTPF